MIVETTTQARTSPDSLAGALANASPEEFAAFWLAFSQQMKGRANELRDFAEHMASAHGANRKIVLKELVRLIGYFEVREELEGAN